jgi:hypothetical protein
MQWRWRNGDDAVEGGTTLTASAKDKVVAWGGCRQIKGGLLSPSMLPSARRVPLDRHRAEVAGMRDLGRSIMSSIHTDA